MPKEDGLSKVIELNEDLLENNEKLAAQNKQTLEKYDKSLRHIPVLY